MVRCFLGILLPNSLKDRVLEIQNSVKPLSDCKLVEYENLHITLSFLGELQDWEISEVKTKLDGVCDNLRKFSIGISGINFIPSRSYLRVIALGVTDGSGSLNKLVGEIRKSIGGDIKPPHLTLCRVRKLVDKQDFISRLSNTDSYCGVMEVGSVNLMKSELSNGGPTYIVLHESELND